MNEMAVTPLASLPAVSSPPDLIHLLQSNDPPQESQIPLIRDMISDDENRILLMDAEIIALETKIHNLNTNLAQSLQKRNDAAVRAHQHRSILSPIRRVPPELIREIFELLHDGKAGTRPPWYFGHISQLWRHTALSLEARTSQNNGSTSSVHRVGHMAYGAAKAAYPLRQTHVCQMFIRAFPLLSTSPSFSSH
jgi:hypothetical protein